MKTGIDLVEISRFKNIDINIFIKRFFTKNERDYVNSKNNKQQTIAGIFACKEAVLKAFKLGIGKGIKLTDIEICHIDGAPRINRNEIIEKYLKENNCKEIDVNISHSENIAIAICIIL